MFIYLFKLHVMITHNLLLLLFLFFTVDVQKDEPTTVLPAMIGSTGSTASLLKLSTPLQLACLIVFQLKVIFKYGTVILL